MDTYVYSSSESRGNKTKRDHEVFCHLGRRGTDIMPNWDFNCQQEMHQNDN